MCYIAIQTRHKLDTNACRDLVQMSGFWCLPSECGTERTGKGLWSCDWREHMGYEDKVVVVVGPQTAYEIPFVQFISL